jgi:SAM-dependent methyltransferase
MNYDLNLSERYDGVAAEFWGLMGGNTPEADLPFFEQAIREGGGRALDLTCGSGKHLIPYLQAGLDVEGVDSSQPMLDACAIRAAAIGKKPALYCQMMQALNLPHRYHTIFISVGSFHLLKEREEAVETLRRCHRHLLPGGKLYVTAYRPAGADDPNLRKRWTMGPATHPKDNSTLKVECWIENVDPANQLVTQRRTYVLTQPGRPPRTQEAVLYQRWYDIDELKAMFASAGFTDIFAHRDFSPEPATEWRGWLVFRGTKSESANKH